MSYDSPIDSERLSLLATLRSSSDTIKNEDPLELPKHLGSWNGGEAGGSVE